MEKKRESKSFDEIMNSHLGEERNRDDLNKGEHGSVYKLRP